MTQDNLKPCPRCGNRAFVVGGYEIWCVSDRCLRLPPRETATEAVEAWNTRTIERLSPPLDGEEMWTDADFDDRFHGPSKPTLPTPPSLDGPAETIDGVETGNTVAPNFDGEGASFQSRVQPWMMACFGPEISADRAERNHRFFEEAGELVQALGMTESEAHQLVSYTWSRPAGEPFQEVGGVRVTLAALCLANGLREDEAAEAELARIWTKVEQIRAKQAAKPKHSPLPAATPPSLDGEGVEKSVRIAFATSLMNANAGMRWLDDDSMDEMISSAWVGFEEPVKEAFARAATISTPREEEVERDAERLRTDFYTGPTYDPKARPGDNVLAAIKLALATLTPREQRMEELLGNLADAEQAYRMKHDIHGGGHSETGRAWDLLRRAGDKARSALSLQDKT